MYKVDQLYQKDSERGNCFDDPTLNIDWQLSLNEIIISVKDLLLSGFEEIEWKF